MGVPDGVKEMLPVFNKTEPLGLPRGSGRLLIALMVTATFCAMFLMGRTLDPALLTMMGVVLTFYFTQRAKETENTASGESVNEPAYGENEQ